VIIERGRLTLGERVGKGGQGDVDAIDATARELEWIGPTVVKIYQKRLAGSALDAFDRRTQWALELPEKAREELYTASCWPLAAVADEGALVGIVMPDERLRHEAQMTLPSGETHTVLLMLEHVLTDDGYLQRRFAMSCDTRVRALIAERLASSLAVLHRHSIVASDISQTNVLISLQEPYAVTMIDCDSMVFRGESTLKQVETPEWQLPDSWSEPANSRGADAYKLGLAILRLFARNQGTRDYALTEPHVPSALRPLLRSALGREVASRPSAGRWQASLRDVLGTPLSRDFPGPGTRPRSPARAAGSQQSPLFGGALASSIAGQPGLFPNATTVTQPAPRQVPVVTAQPPNRPAPARVTTTLTPPPAMPSKRPWRAILAVAVIAVIVIVAATSGGSHPSIATGASRPPTPPSVPQSASVVARARGLVAVSSDGEARWILARGGWLWRWDASQARMLRTTQVSLPASTLYASAAWEGRYAGRTHLSPSRAPSTTTPTADARSVKPAPASTSGSHQAGSSASPSPGSAPAASSGGGSQQQGSAGGGLQGSNEASSPPAGGGSAGLEGSSGGSGGGGGGLAGSSE
jgi:hypothetical protein